MKKLLMFFSLVALTAAPVLVPHGVGSGGDTTASGAQGEARRDSDRAPETAGLK